MFSHTVVGGEEATRFQETSVCCGVGPNRTGATFDLQNALVEILEELIDAGFVPRMDREVNAGGGSLTIHKPAALKE
jgi:hypothetical protein